MKERFKFTHKNDVNFGYTAQLISKWQYVVLWIDNGEQYATVYGIKEVERLINEKYWKVEEL